MYTGNYHEAFVFMAVVAVMAIVVFLVAIAAVVAAMRQGDEPRRFPHEPEIRGPGID